MDVWEAKFRAEEDLKDAFVNIRGCGCMLNEHPVVFSKSNKQCLEIIRQLIILQTLIQEEGETNE